MKTIYVNFNLDDIHPQSSSVGQDFGGDRQHGVFRHLFALIEEFPKIKITLFTTPNYIDKSNDPFLLRNIKKLFGANYRRTWVGEPFKITKHKAWCDWLNSVKNFEIALHGYNHHNESAGLHQQEFHNLTEEEAEKRIKAAEQLCKEAGLDYVRGFRPPGWGTSPGMFAALRKLKMKFVALDATHFPGSNNCKVHQYEGLTNIPQNWDSKTGTIEDAKALLEKTNFISIKGHITEYCDKDKTFNGLSHQTIENIIKLINWLQEEYEVKFVTMEEMAKK